MKLNRKKAAALMMAGCMMFSNVLPAYAANEKDVNKKKSEIESQIQSKEQTVQSLKKDKQEVLSAIKKLDEKHIKAQEKLTSLGEQIDTKEGEIQENTKNLEKAREEEAAQYEDMKKRIQYLYESGNSSMISIIFESKDFAEVLSRAENFQQMTAYDRNKLEEYKETCQTILNLEKKLEKEKSDLEGYKKSAEEEKASIESIISKKQDEISVFEAGIDSAIAQKADLEGELAVQNEILRQIGEEKKKAAAKAAAEKAAAEKAAAEKAAAEKAAAEEAEKNAANNKPDNSTDNSTTDKNTNNGNTESGGTGNGNAGFSGGFMWPCSGPVTSPFGYREAPTAGASTYHQGIDIGAGSGAPIVAAASGTVTVSAYSESAGNYVTIDHGNGFHSVYMHASALYVSAGQRVSAGQQIAAVGSTGYSTGPHLHFGIMKNGSYVNPMNYL